jgi:hypothetical protein
MRSRTVFFLASLFTLTGCQTHLSLRDNTVLTNGTLSDLNYRQVLDNIALFTVNESSMPWLGVINAGTVTVADQKSVGLNSTYAPTVVFAQQSGAGVPIFNMLFNPNASRTVTENWSMQPVTDVDNLRRIRCAFQLLVLRGGQTTECFDCKDLLSTFYLGEIERVDCLIPLGWYYVGCKKDVPKDAAYVGKYKNTYIWVDKEGVEGLTRFSMTILDLATGKPHAPTKTVVKTFKSDGSLDNTQVTTTEIDADALKNMKKGDGTRDRPRQYVNSPVVNPGLFFIPR